MKMAVVPHCGPLMAAPATWPIQLSPRASDSPLCWEFGAVGMTNETLGREPAVAWSTTACAVNCFAFWAVNSHWAIVGHPAQMPCDEAPESILQETPAASIRSRMVAAGGTRD